MGKRTSAVWNFFTDLGGYKAKCHLCGAEISFKTTVNNLKKHASRKHKVLNGPASDYISVSPVGLYEVVENRSESSNVEEEELNLQDTRDCLSQLVTDIEIITPDSPSPKKTVAAPRYSKPNSYQQQSKSSNFDVASVVKELKKSIQETVQYGISNAIRQTKNLDQATKVISDKDECALITKHIYLQLKQLPEEDMLEASMDIQQILIKHRLKIKKRQASLLEESVVQNIQPLHTSCIEQSSKNNQSSQNSDVTIVIEGIHSLEDELSEKKLDE